MHCIYSLKAEVSLSCRAGAGQTKLTCMAVYSFLLILLPSRMLSIRKKGDNWPQSKIHVNIFVFQSLPSAIITWRWAQAKNLSVGNCVPKHDRKFQISF